MVGQMLRQLSEVDYLCPHGSKGTAAYYREGNKIYLTGLTPPRKAPNTTNAAESVIRAICHNLGVRWQDQVFVEIRTWRSHPDEVKSGVCRAKRIVCGHDRAYGPQIISWRDCELPPEIKDLFGPYIN